MWYLSASVFRTRCRLILSSLHTPSRHLRRLTLRLPIVTGMLLAAALPQKATGQFIYRDTVLTGQHTLTDAVVTRGVTLTIASGAEVTVEGNSRHGLSTFGGTIIVRAAADVYLTTGRIHVESYEGTPGRFVATVARFHGNENVITITDSYAEISDCKLERVALGYRTGEITGPETETPDSEYDIKILRNVIDSAYRDGAMGLGSGRILVEENKISFPGGSRTTAVSIDSRRGLIDFRENEVTLDDELGGGSAISVSLSASGKVAITDNNFIELSPSGSFSGGLGVGCSGDDPQPSIDIIGNIFFKFGTAIGVSNCDAIIADNWVNGAGIAVPGRVVRLTDVTGKFLGNEIRNYVVENASVSSNDGRILHAEGARPLTIENNVVERTGLSAIAPTDFQFSLVHVEGAAEVVSNQFVDNTITSARTTTREPAVLSVAENLQYNSPVRVVRNVFRGNTIRGTDTHTATGAKGTLVYMYFRFPADTMEVVDNLFDGATESVTGLHLGGAGAPYDKAAVYRNTFQNGRVGAFTSGRPNFTGDNAFRANESYHLQRSLVSLDTLFSRSTLYARSNDWGTTNPLEIDALIFDDEEANNINVGPVDFGDSRHEQFTVTLSTTDPVEVLDGDTLGVTATVRDLANNPREVAVYFTREPIEGEDVFVLKPWSLVADQQGIAKSSLLGTNPGVARLQAHAKDAHSGRREVTVIARVGPVVRVMQDPLIAANEPIPLTSFDYGTIDLSKKADPITIVGTAATDANGLLTLPDSFRPGGPFLIRHKKKQVAAIKKGHEAVDKLRYVLSVDNMRVDRDGLLVPDSLETNPDDTTKTYMEHTSVGANLVVSVEWKPLAPYVENVEKALRSASNYLYDVTDGQAYLNKVAVYDDKENWGNADVYIHASNTAWPSAHVWGINSAVDRHVNMPPKFTGQEVSTIGVSYSENPLNPNEYNNYATLVHELGHYFFGFYDEYIDANKKKIFPTAEGAVPAQETIDFGFMDRQYPEARERASEMSAFVTDEYKLTGQYQRNAGIPTFEYFRNLFRDVSHPVRAEIHTPQLLGLTPREFLAGPNNDLGNPDFDIGAKLVFVDKTSKTSQAYAEYLITNGNNQPIPGAIVAIYQRSKKRWIWLGKTVVKGPDRGKIRLRGAKAGDKVSISRIEKPLTWEIYEENLQLGGGKTAQDLQVVQLVRVAGDYRFIPSLSLLGPDELDLSLETNGAFSSPPTLVAFPEGADSVSTVLELVGANVFEASLANLDRDSVSTLNLRSVDDAARPFFVPLGLTFTDIDSTVTWVYPENQSLRLDLDEGANRISRLAILSSDFPTLRTGLPDSVRRVTPTYAITGYATTSDLMGDLTLFYSGDSLLASVEDAVSVYEWTGSWQQLDSQAQIDTTEQAVTARIDGPGIYAAFLDLTRTTAVGVDDPGRSEPDSRTGFRLLPNYPNPFTEQTTVVYHIDRTMPVQLSIYNVLGQLVAKVVDELASPGRHEVVIDARVWGSGVYFCVLSVDEVREVRPMLVVKGGPVGTRLR